MSKSINLSPVSYQIWLKLVFAPLVSEKNESGLPECESEGDWRDADFHISNPTRLTEHMTRLCREFRSVANFYTLEQINRGIWFLLGTQVEFGKVLADIKVPTEKRVEYVRAVFFVYADFVAPSEVEEMENCFDMWWDLLCTDFWGAHLWRLKGDEIMEQMQREDEDSDARLSLEEKKRWEQMEEILSQLKPGEDTNEVLQQHGFSFDDFRSDENPKLSTGMDIEFEDLAPTEHQVMDAMLETLTKILYLDEERCASYALHGLNHLQHPQRAATVQKFIDSHSQQWDEQALEWVESCRDGKAM